MAGQRIGSADRIPYPLQMKLICISDTHNCQPEVPNGDILVHAGDLTMSGTRGETLTTLRWLDQLPHKIKLFIAGNHDFYFEEDFNYDELENYPSIRYLEDSAQAVDGIKFYGTPWQPWFYDWAFKLPRNGWELQKVWNEIPEDTDVLVTHAPPFGTLDVTRTGERVGCELLTQRLKEVKPRLHVFGHIHESYGPTGRKPDGITYFNASVCDGLYNPVNAPLEFDW